MEWIKQNRFFAGYAGIMIVGVLGLGFWLYKGWSGYSAAKRSYDDIHMSVTALESEKIYPNKENLAEKEARVSRYTVAVDSLQRQAGKLQRDLKAGYSEQQFRNLRNKETKAIVDLAAEKNMILPKDFALGFNEYNQGIGVPPHAVSVLEWEFDAIKRFIHIVAESGVESLDEFSRDKIPQERPDWKPEGERPKKPERGRRPAGRKPPRGKRPTGRMALAGRDKGPMASASKVMETYRIMAKVTGSYESLTALLNQIAADEEFFMWLRRVRIENQKKESPQIPNDLPRMIKITKPGAQANENGDLPEVDVEVDAEVIFGNEKMQAILVVDILRFKVLEIPEKSTSAVSSIPIVPGLQSAVSVNEIP